MFGNEYMTGDFESREVKAQAGDSYRVMLHYLDGEAGPATAKCDVDLVAQAANFRAENAEVLSCLTGYL
ncbi:hypothetical protein [Thiohalorhabdus sp.]|uniref:hypothetical protein n=1 Tax=Thiohalorhabdus sp. TaxID=3094134 RepID=UPI002FC35308